MKLELEGFECNKTKALVADFVPRQQSGYSMFMRLDSQVALIFLLEAGTVYLGLTLCLFVCWMPDKIKYRFIVQILYYFGY